MRAAACHDEVMVDLSRQHNDVNVLCLPGDLIGDRNVDELVLKWLQTEFDGGRHAGRVEKIDEIEKDTSPAAQIHDQALVRLDRQSTPPGLVCSGD